MRIGELAHATGTSTRALRHYEEQGLLSSARALNGYRDYSAEALLRVRNIRELLAIGFTTSDVRAFLNHLDQELPPAFADAGGCATAMRVANQRLARLRERIQTLTHLHDRLAARMPEQPSAQPTTDPGQRGSKPAPGLALSTQPCNADPGALGLQD